MQKVIHIDCDCFYAALETRDGPSLHGKTLAAGGSPDERGAVITYSYEARAYGVRSTIAMRTTLKLRPGLLVVRPRFDVYRAVSKQIHAIFHDYTDLIRPLSLDEAYLDVSASPRFAGSTTRIAQDIHRRVIEELHIIVSASVAPSRSLAKITSGWHKPDGLLVITPEQIDGFVAELPVAKLHGIGKITAERLAWMGIRACIDPCQGSKLSLMHKFGGFGGRLWELAHGIDERPVEVDSRRQSVSVECTFDRSLPDLVAYLEELPTLPRELDGRLQRPDDSYRPDRPFVKLKSHDFTRTMVEQSDAGRGLRSYRQLLDQAFACGNRPMHLIGVGVRLFDLRGAREQLRLS